MQKRSIGEFICTIVLWLVIGALVQWLMQSHAGMAQGPTGLENALGGTSSGGGGNSNNAASTGAGDSGLTTYWNALVIVSLFFGVLAFLARDLRRENPLSRLLRVIGTRLMGTTFDIGLFALGGVLFLLWGPHNVAVTIPQWQSLFIGVGLPVFIVILVALGIIQALMKYTRVSLVSVPALEYKPLVRVGLYTGLLILLILAAWLAI